MRWAQAWRSLWRSPGFVAAATLSLGLATGAGRTQIVSMVLSQATRVTLVGIAIGFAAAAFGLRLASGLLYGTPPNDPLVCIIVAFVSLAIPVLAGALPALRAARIGPTVALRTE